MLGSITVGVPKETKAHEYRVGLVPDSVRELTRRGHAVLVETQAGSGIGCTDDEYVNSGATIVRDAGSVFTQADLIVKVKEPNAAEIARLRRNQVLFTYLHLAADKQQAEGLVNSGAVCIAYETVSGDRERLPLLSPMSEVAGRMAVQVGAHYLEKHQGGRGVLLSGVPGVLRASVLIVGGGVAGTNAAAVALGMGAEVTVIDLSLTRLRELEVMYGHAIQTLCATDTTIADVAKRADLLIGAALIPGARAPRLLSSAAVRDMNPGSVIVDVSIDQGGCFDTSRPTTHSSPVYVSEGVIHYCVTNMPGAVPRTSAFALNNATLPHVLALANKGWREALISDLHLLEGLNVCEGQITHPAVANDLGMKYVPAGHLLH